MNAEALRAAVEARLPLAAALFDAIRAESTAAAGVTRPAWSALDRAAADGAGNFYCTLPGRDRSAAASGLSRKQHLGILRRFEYDMQKRQQ